MGPRQHGHQLQQRPQVHQGLALANITRIGGTLTLASNPELHICTTLYAKLQSAAQNRMASSNLLPTSFERREDCNHRCT